MTWKRTRNLAPRPCRNCGVIFEGVRCKDCAQKRMRVWYYSEAGRDYYKHCLRRQRRHGLTLAEAEALFEKQGNVCAICKRPATDKRSRLHVDHCHKTGKVRGGLCIKCNVGLGLTEDNVETLRAMITYLEQHK